MTTVTFYKKNECFTGFTAQGHALFADAGNDIVCAAISVLVINTINSIDDLVHDDFELINDDKECILGIMLEKSTNPDTQLLLRSLKMGLDGICSEYGKKYLKIKTKEVNDNVKA